MTYPSKKEIINSFDYLFEIIRELGKDTPDYKDLSKIKKFVNAVNTRNTIFRDFKKDLERHQNYIKAVPLEVPNFKDVDLGTFVLSSNEFALEYEHNPNLFIEEDRKFFRGIIINKSYEKDDLCDVVTYPVIHWEGFPNAMETHPKDVIVPNQDLPLITMNSNQLK